MCEVKVFYNDNGNEELLMEDVVVLRPQDGDIYIANLFGEEKSVKGDIKEIHFLNHKIVIDKKV